MCTHTHTQNQCSPFLPNSKYFLFCLISFSAYCGHSLISWLNYGTISWITDILQHRTLQQDVPSTLGQSKSSSDSLIAFWIQLWVQGQRRNKLERILEFLPFCCSGGAVEQFIPPCPSHCSATSVLSPVCNPILSKPTNAQSTWKNVLRLLVILWLWSNYTWGDRKATNTCFKTTVLKISSTLLSQPVHPKCPKQYGASRSFSFDSKRLSQLQC